MEKRDSELLHGTLDMLILHVLADGPLHGYAIAQELKRLSKEVLEVEQGSLYPALYRMERRGWLAAKWGMSERKRRAKFYRLTRAGKNQLAVDSAGWRQFAAAIEGVMDSGEGKGT